jgi:hypothetical protein
MSQELKLGINVHTKYANLGTIESMIQGIIFNFYGGKI